MNYLASLENAIEYIEQHLDDEIRPDDIAKAAGYSLYHLTHIFTAVIGEPIGGYIQKRKLSNAARILLYSKKRVIDIAVESGFHSSEAFSRAFKSVYGISPSAYRKQGIELYVGSKKKLDKDTLQHLSTVITVKPQLVEMDAVRVAGIRGETSTLHNTLPALWEQFRRLEEKIPAINSTRAFGICETGRVETQITAEGNVVFSEIVGVEVDANYTPPEGIVIKTLRGGKYAVFTHRGAIATFQKTYDYIWGSWVLSTKESLDNSEDFEIYDERFMGANNSESQIDIYIPVK